MATITNSMIHKAYDIAKQIYNNQITRLEGISFLESIGMKESSAHDYIYFYYNLVRGKLFTRTTNVFATEYYLRKIHEEQGDQGLKTALLSLAQHFDYYEALTKRPVIARRMIYDEYLKLVDISNEDDFYGDDIDPELTYPEGKVKKILVNTYERNPVARKCCIDYHGCSCKVCGFNFEDIYGTLGRGFIHVHHIIDISTVGNEYSVDPITDLAPVCPNCHAMLHKKKPAYTIEELRGILYN